MRTYVCACVHGYIAIPKHGCRCRCPALLLVMVSVQKTKQFINPEPLSPIIANCLVSCLPSSSTQMRQSNMSRKQTHPTDPRRPPPLFDMPEAHTNAHRPDNFACWKHIHTITSSLNVSQRCSWCCTQQIPSHANPATAYLCVHR